MPTSDIIFFAIGIAAFAFVLVFIAWTGFVAHKPVRAVDNEKSPQTTK